MPTFIGSHSLDVELLDLSQSLVSSWGELARLCACLPRLESLYVSLNRFVLVHAPPTPHFGTLTTLHLNAANVTWEQVSSPDAVLDVRLITLF